MRKNDAYLLEREEWTRAATKVRAMDRRDEAPVTIDEARALLAEAEAAWAARPWDRLVQRQLAAARARLAAAQRQTERQGQMTLEDAAAPE